MGTIAATHAPRRAASAIRRRIERGGERLWRMDDFRDLPFTAVAQALSRLNRQGLIERLSKGIYYRTRPTAFGKSRPNPASIQKLAAQRKAIFPTGLAAANLLGFTTQNPRRAELGTTALSLPRKLVGQDAIIRTRRPQAWENLSETDAALLDFLRQAGKTSELSPEETIRRTLSLLATEQRFERLLKAAASEPPRVRALLAALGEQLENKATFLMRLRSSLNPLTRFDFGAFAKLPNARAWQAKEHH